ncbi:N-acetylmuramoyl-L-alanine amidase CwlD [Aquibacillus sp. 3ASR75-11]|uniref:N-acetylmuramoyl-L-alanine amidase CwlD n=1 Tax=Terrihalobacillus insolitus TaxID=2950438 RepID=A0A9X3WYB8_9BACI|nr:N-acetylmuramoyl-L-alanine amidase CwlD [Terrihalobacillus insolitus]MDC3425554.1 N-acetylmuramoyl-L-alanine amidase CwlD [Terrihalobacillus insolitus]
MGRYLKIISWIVGAFLLVFLIQYPIQKSQESWDTWSLPLSGKVIVLDPGHGGVDGGAVGKDNTLEKDIVLKIAKDLQNYLQQSGALVYLTREEDKDLADEGTDGLARRKVEDIRRRVEFIKDKEADFFVSLHLNALPSTRWNGAQTFYYPGLEDSENLAKFIQAEIKRNLENTKRQALALNGMYILKNADSPGALVEMGFLSNKHERELLKTEKYQHKMAGSIYEGILRFVTEKSTNEG